jgi:hypothetical protein
MVNKGWHQSIYVSDQSRAAIKLAMTLASLSILRKHVKPQSFYGACEDQFCGLAYQGN